MANPIWDAGPDLALLFLCMKLVSSRPQDGIESSQNPIYLSVKRFIALLEMSGAATLMILQANVLVFWYEYGQAIYPAAWMTAGWCVRYGNLLGISGQTQATQLLGRPVRTKYPMTVVYSLTSSRVLGPKRKNAVELGGQFRLLIGDLHGPLKNYPANV